MVVRTETNLPNILTSFIGREHELAEVRELITSNRLVTITGAGGCGKTRLAYEVGADVLADFPDGVWVVELASLSAPELVAETVASALGLSRHDAIDGETDGILERLVGYLERRRLLIILDNCEHLLEASAELSLSVLRECSNVRILATSRERMGAEGEAAWRLPSLAVPGAGVSADQLGAFDSVRLFEDRARQVDDRFRISDSDPEAVAEICRRLDGIPLAIELAAARAQVLSPTEIASRLGDVFRLLTRGRADRVERHETLWTAIDWSYRLLGEHERRLFGRLSVFVGGFSLEAVEAVCAGDGLDADPIDALTALVEGSLVGVEHQDGGTRYRMLETIREFATAKLEEPEEIAGVRGRHLEFFLSLGERYGGEIFRADQRHAVAILRADEGNIRRALEWGWSNDPEKAVRLLAVVMPFWATIGERTEGRRWLEKIATTPDDACPPDVLARALNPAALLLCKVGDFAASGALSRRALRLAEGCGDTAAEAAALRDIAYTLTWQGDYAAAIPIIEQAVAKATEADDKVVLAYAVDVQAMLAGYIGDLDRSRALYEEKIALRESLGDKHRANDSLRGLGALDLHEGDVDTARLRLDAVLAYAREIGCGECISNTCFVIGNLARREGALAEAARWYSESLGIAMRLEMLPLMPAALEGIAAVAGDLDRAAVASKLLGAAHGLRDTLGTKPPPIVASAKAMTALGSDGLERYRRVLEESLGREAFSLCFREGRLLPLRAALEEAREVAAELSTAEEPDQPLDAVELLRGRYESLEIIGSGGQGEVVKAHDHQHDRRVALKIRPAGDPEHRQALLSEARILLGLRPHAGLPLVRDDFIADDRYVIVMDWVEGTDLRTVLDHQGDPGLPVGSVLSYLKDVAEALDHLHSHDPPIVHGDVKPANCILTPQGRVVLVDFGIASGDGRERVVGSGTRGFVAPEVAAGDAPTAATDVFGLAATAYALLTGRSPEGEWADIEGVAPHVARTLGRAMRLGLSLDPGRRPRRAGELVERLHSWQEATLPIGTVTFVFTDIEGSTPLWDEHPGEMPRVIVRHEQLIAEAVESNGGRFVKSRGEGDSTLSVFTRASDAVAAAIAMQRAIAAEAWPARIDLRVRAALHTGEAQLREGDYFGTSVNRAARLRGIGQGGHVLVSQATAQLVADTLPEDAVLVDHGSHELRGLARAERVFQLIAPRMPQVTFSAGPERDTGIGTPGPTIERPSWLDPAQRGSIVGREDELGLLDAAWKQARDGRPTLVFVTGEPGIGKTRLVAEFATVAGGDALVLAGQCYEEAIVPFQPFVEALRSYVSGSATESLRTDLGRAAPEIARLVPEVAERLGDLPEPSRAGWETERYAMFDAVTQTLVAASRRAPVLLVLDDLHWADRPTLFLLRHLLRSATSAPLMVIATLRDDDVGPEIAEAAGELRRTDANANVRLAGLTPETVETLLADRAGTAVPGPVARVVSNETEGNPFFVEEVLRHLTEAGAIDEDGNWRDDFRARELGIPEGVKAVIGRRLSRLSQESRRALASAAVIGRDFGLGVLEHVVDLEGDDLLDVLDEAIAARVVTEMPGSTGAFQFTHALVRETLYESLSSPRRERVHRRVGEALERTGDADAPGHLAALAFHFFEAGPTELDRAIGYGVRAGEAARRQLAYEEAASHLGRALDALDRAGPADPSRSCTILLALGDAQERAGFRAQARKTFLAAAEQARELDASEQLAEAALGVAGPGWGELGVVDDGLLGLFEEALGAIGDADGSLRVRLLARLAIELPVGERGRGRGSRLSREAVAMARRLQDPEGLAFALVSRLWTDWGPGIAAERIRHADEILAIAAETGLLELAREARQGRLLSFLEMGDMAAVDREIEAETELAAELRLPLFQATVTQDRATRALMAGRFEEAEALGLESLAEGGEDANVVVAYGAQLLLTRWEQGRLHEMVEPLRDFANQYPGLPSFRCCLAAVCAELGMLDAARRELALIVGAGLHSLPLDTLPLSLSLLALACDPLGDGSTAQDLYGLLEPYAGELVMIRSAATLGPAHRYLGLLAGLGGDWSLAERHLEQALEVCTRIDSQPWRARAQHDLARMLLRRNDPGDRDRAAELAAQAQGTTRALGMNGLAAKTAMLMDGAARGATGRGVAP